VSPPRSGPRTRWNCEQGEETVIERYTRKVMGNLWGEEAKFQSWLEVELAVCEVLTARGTIPAGDMEIIREKAGFDLARIDEIEATAEQETLDRERQLRADVEAAEVELRAKQQELSGNNAALFQKRLQDEVDRLNETVQEGNRELREIRKARREALEKEEAKVRRSVLGWMPTLVLVVGLTLAVRRRRKHVQALGR